MSIKSTNIAGQHSIDANLPLGKTFKKSATI
jgi:hypothetical protein